MSDVVVTDPEGRVVVVVLETGEVITALERYGPLSPDQLAQGGVKLSLVVESHAGSHEHGKVETYG